MCGLDKGLCSRLAALSRIDSLCREPHSDQLISPSQKQLLQEWQMAYLTSDTEECSLMRHGL